MLRCAKDATTGEPSAALAAGSTILEPAIICCGLAAVAAWRKWLLIEKAEKEGEVMRLIDADALMDAFRSYMAEKFDRERCVSEENCKTCERGCLWRKIVNNAPTVGERRDSDA